MRSRILAALGAAVALSSCPSPSPASNASRASREAGASCPQPCPAHHVCDPVAHACICALGWAGATCSSCAPGFSLSEGGCALTPDGAFAEWPNPVSRLNSDSWLAVHHAQIRTLRPKLLVVNFVNKSSPAGVRSLIDAIIADLAEGSRVQGFKDPVAPAQLVYSLAKDVIDLRDGVNGRPPAPAGYAYENSTLYPRSSGDRFDYGRFFSAAFARHYGYVDASQPGGFRDLCTLVQRGDIHELWFVFSGDVPDANAYEVLEAKPRYTAAGNQIPGSVERCAGNGCFESSVPFCGRSLRIGAVNYNRGPGCFLESLGHGTESSARCGALPALKEWFVPFGNFQLDSRYGLPLDCWYALGCPTPPCLSYPTETSAQAVIAGVRHDLSPYDAICGNVHFPPNGRQHYDVTNPQRVLSSCTGFGRHAGPGGADAMEMVSSASWSRYRAAASDCDGPFLVWWAQNMPGFGSGQTFPDGRPMSSRWPFLFY